jgi:hypothetical protein
MIPRKATRRERKNRMRRVLLVCGLLILASCTGEKSPPATPVPDTSGVRAAPDTTRLRDSTSRRGDSVMVRDTAKGV